MTSPRRPSVAGFALRSKGRIGRRRDHGVRSLPRLRGQEPRGSASSAASARYDLRGQCRAAHSQPKAGSAQVMRSGSLKGVFGLAVLGVVGHRAGRRAPGLLPGGDVITDVRNKIPFLAAESQRRLGRSSPRPPPASAPPCRSTGPREVSASSRAPTGTIDAVGEHPGARDRPRHRAHGGSGPPSPPRRRADRGLAELDCASAWAASTGRHARDVRGDPFQGHPPWWSGSTTSQRRGRRDHDQRPADPPAGATCS